MDIVVDMALRSTPEEVVVASGKTVYARHVVSELFAMRGLDARSHLLEEVPPSEPGPDFVVNIGQLAETSGRRPCKTVFDILDDILHARRENHLATTE